MMKFKKRNLPMKILMKKIQQKNFTKIYTKIEKKNNT